MADQWYKFGHGFLLVYSITDRPTFDAVYGFHQDVLRVKDRPYVPCVVASNKVSGGGGVWRLSAWVGSLGMAL